MIKIKTELRRGWVLVRLLWIAFGIRGCQEATAAPPAPGVLTTNYTLIWDYPAGMPLLSSYVPGTNVAFNIYGTQTLGLAMSNWPTMYTLQSWALATNNGKVICCLSNATAGLGGAWFFVITASNITGESFFSNPALTGPAVPAQLAGVVSLLKGL
jgi:hypothetical protein